MSTDGLLFIARDGTKKERPMTEEECLKFRTQEFEQQQFTTGSMPGSSNYPQKA